ncbi:aldo/keto reductase [Alloscardovia criceti]|uniref:aldo/keto reductase n=1 Tax=Alloscardovia criceti TaxID=356828 RepID=UPI0003824EC0|nr:aldo/keto reductase [Alloscardovia criceti]
MEKREAARLGTAISEIGLGTWQLGTDWGDVSPEQANEVLETAVQQGINFIDTADVYGDGRSEKFIGEFRQRHLEDNLFIATKMGRRSPQVFEEYTQEHFLAWNDRSRANLQMDTLDLVQLHCPPTDVITAQRTYDYLDTMVDEGRIARYGVSVETCEQALLAMERDNVASVQIILNIFRRKPLEEVLPRALETGTAIIVRVPLASGLLSGKYTKDTTFALTDHRNYNRHGEHFDVGETFAGVPFEVGVEAAQEFSALAAKFVPDATPAQAALRWILQQPGVTTVIPGGRNVSQVTGNAGAAALAELPQELMDALEDLYDSRIREHVHDRW